MESMTRIGLFASCKEPGGDELCLNGEWGGGSCGDRNDRR